MVFDDWEWNALDVQKLMAKVTLNLKGATLNTQLTTKEPVQVELVTKWLIAG